MAKRTARWFPVLALLVLAWTPVFLAASPAQATEARRIVTSDNADYFGFDLRSEQNVTLDQCETACLGDSSCRLHI